jgi:malonyl CoA-acyl carrier protein transacylase
MSFYPDMMRDLAIMFPRCRSAFDELEEALCQEGGSFTPSSFVFPPAPYYRHDADIFRSGAYAQALVSIYAGCAGLTRMLRDIGVSPDGVVGFGGGDLAALMSSGTAGENPPRPDRVRVLREIYRIVDKAVNHGGMPEIAMLTVVMRRAGEIDEVVESFPQDKVTLVVDFSPRQKTFAVVRDFEEMAMAAFARAGVRAMKMPFDRPFNTRQCDKLVPVLKKFAASWMKHDPVCDVYSCASAERLPNRLRSARADIGERWAKPVRFEETIRRMYGDGYRVFLEVGPRGLMTSAVDDTLKGETYAAIALNSIHRTGILQAQHAIAQLAEENGKTMFEIMENANAYLALARTAPVLVEFTALINELTELSTEASLEKFVREVLDRTGYRKMIEDAGQAEADRLENLDEFISGVIEYQNNAEEPTLTGFLEETALVADVDRYDDTADAVVLMTIHSSKGLEFPIVFLPGMEDGIFPGMQTITGGPEEMEEERRLAYVAVTRAKDALYVLHAKNRLLYGRTTCNPISRFMEEIPDELIEKVEAPAPMARTGAPQGASGSGGYGTGYSGRTAAGGTYGTYGAKRPAQPRPHDTMTISQSLFKKKEGGNTEAFSAGDRVCHAVFGGGEILSVRPMGKDILYEVAFDKVGTKKRMATYAKLKREE